MLKKEIKIGKSKLSFEIRKTTTKEKIQGLVAIALIVAIIYFLNK